MNDTLMEAVKGIIGCVLVGALTTFLVSGGILEHAKYGAAVGLVVGVVMCFFMEERDV